MARNRFLTLITLLLFLMTGCTKQPQEQPETHTPTLKERLNTRGLHKIMYITQSLPPFIQGEAVEILGIEGDEVYTQKGTIPITLLEEKPSEFSLTVKTDEGARVRIMNVKPKYHDNIYLKPDNYLIEVSKTGYEKQYKWIELKHNSVVPITLTPKTLSTSHTFLWSKKALKTHRINLESVVMIGDTLWHDVQRDKQYRWSEGATTCADSAVQVSQHYRVTHFNMPSLSAFEELQKHPAWFHHATLDAYDYWSSQEATDKMITKVLELSEPPSKVQKQQYASQKILTSFSNQNHELSSINLSFAPKTYASNLLCVKEHDTFLDIPLDTLQENIYDAYGNSSMDASEQSRLSMQEAFHLKYGLPKIKNVTCKAQSATCAIAMTSERNALRYTISTPVASDMQSDFINAVHNIIEPDLHVSVAIDGKNITSMRIEALNDMHTLLMDYYLNAAFFSVKALNKLIASHKLDPAYTQKAQERIAVLKKRFNGYEAQNPLELEGCHYYYPQKVIDTNTKKSLKVDYWDKISGKFETCNDGWLEGKTTLYFFSEKGVFVKLKGDMKRGLFEGAIKYRNSKDPAHATFIKPIQKEVWVSKAHASFDYHIGH